MVTRTRMMLIRNGAWFFVVPANADSCGKLFRELLLGFGRLDEQMKCMQRF